MRLRLSMRFQSLLHPVTLLVLIVSLALVHGRQARENRRDFQKLAQSDLGRIAELGPSQWESVDEGHLKALLIPRACKSPLIWVGDADTLAGSANR
jgi:hypothetical protein